MALFSFHFGIHSADTSTDDKMSKPRNDESASSESSQTESDTSSSDWEIGFLSAGRSGKCSRAFLIGNGRHKRSAESICSVESDNNRPRHKRAKIQSVQPPVNLVKPQERTGQPEGIWSPGDSSGTDDEDDSGTDPDFDSDDTVSESGDDSYAEGTKEMVAGMRDRWERHVKKQSGMGLTLINA
jgi:hypothetical protein